MSRRHADDRYEERERYYERRERDVDDRPPRRVQEEELEMEIERNLRERRPPRAASVVSERPAAPRQPDFLRDDYDRPNAGPLVIRETERVKDLERAAGKTNISVVGSRRGSGAPVDRVKEEIIVKDKVVVDDSRSDSGKSRRSTAGRALPYPAEDRIPDAARVEYRETVRERPGRQVEEEEIIVRRNGKDYSPPPRRKDFVDDRESEVYSRRAHSRGPPRKEVEREEMRIRETRPAQPVEVERRELVIREQESPPRRYEREYEEIDVRERERSRPPPVIRGYGPPIAREREEFVFRRRRSPSPPPPREEREEVIVRRREISPSPPPRQEREEVIIRRREISPSPPPPPRQEREEVIIRRREISPSPPPRQEREEVIIRRRDISPSPPPRREREEIIIRRRAVSPSPPPRAPSPEPIPSPPRQRTPSPEPMPLLYRQPIVQHVYTHHHYIEHSPERAPRAPSPPLPRPPTPPPALPAPPSKAKEESLEIEIRRKGTRAGGEKVYDRELIIDREKDPVQRVREDIVDVRRRSASSRPAPKREEIRRDSGARLRRDMWTEVAKDLVIKEAIELQGYDYEETEKHFYVIEYLEYEDVLKLVELSEDIKRDKKERAKDERWRREDEERSSLIGGGKGRFEERERERIHEHEVIYDSRDRRNGRYR